MKKLLIGVATLSLLGAGAASAQDNGDHNRGGGDRGDHQSSAPARGNGNSGPARSAPTPAPRAQGGPQFRGDSGLQGGQPRGDMRGQGGQFRNDQGARGGQFRGDANPYRGDARTQGGQFRNDQDNQNRGYQNNQSRAYQNNENRGYQNNQYRGSQGNQYRGDPRARAGGQFNTAGRNWTHNDFRNWRGGRGPWVNDRNWFRNNWRFQSPDRFRAGFYNWPRGWNGYRNWYYGAILPSVFFNDDYILSNWYDFGLYEPPYGYEWVRVGPDALLLDPNTGMIVQVDNDAFY